jgi:hypothetical protein
VKFAFAFIAFMVAAKAAFGCSPSLFEEGTLVAFEQEVTVVLKEHRNASVIDFNFLPSQCKSWPQKPGYAILAKPYLYENGRNGERYFGMVVAVANETTGKVLSKINEENLMAADAVEPSEVSIDVANYAIKSGHVAFGVRITRRNYSDTAPVRKEVMNLYVLDQGPLRKVINSLPMNSYSGEGNGDCTFSGTENSATLIILSGKTNGYYDFRERFRTVRIDYAKGGSECKKKEGAAKIKDYVLKYNGTTYEIPQVLQVDVN